MAGRRVAIVTGASSGMGLATALALARRKYAVLLAARRTDRLTEAAKRCEQAGGVARAVTTDVTDRRQVEALVSAAAGEFGRVDVMVNNAGVGLFARVHETTDADMRAIFETNFFSVFNGCKAVAPIMIRQGGGHIFNVSSVIGKRGTPFHGAYCATKFAVCGLTDSLRVELAVHKVRVTSVCPALTATEFFDHSPRGRRARSSFRTFTSLTPAAVVGRKIAATVGRNVPELVFTPGGKFLTLIAALCPRAADAMMRLYHDDLAKRLRGADEAEDSGDEAVTPRG